MAGTLTQNRRLVELANNLEAQLLKTHPFGIADFGRAYSSDPLVGESVMFRGSSRDAAVALVVEFIPSFGRGGTCDALSCRIEKGDKRIYLAHFLSLKGKSPEIFSNTKQVDPKEFINAAVHALAALDEYVELRDVMDGHSWVEVPFDWGDAR